MARASAIMAILAFCILIIPISAEENLHTLQKHTYDNLVFHKSYVVSKWSWIDVRNLEAYNSILDFGFEANTLQAFNTMFKKYVIVKKFVNIANCTALQGIGILPRVVGSICLNGTLSVHVKTFSFTNLGTSYKDILKEYGIKINICPTISGIVFVAKRVQLKNFYSLDTRIAVERGGYGKIVDSSLREARVYKGGILFFNEAYVDMLTCEGTCVGKVLAKTLYLSRVSKIENIDKDSLKVRFENGKSLTVKHVQKIFVMDSNDLNIIIKGYSMDLSMTFSNTSAFITARNIELKKVVVKNNSSITLDYQYATEIRKDDSSKILKTISLIRHDVGREERDSIWMQYGQEIFVSEILIKYWDSSVVTTQEYLSTIYKFHPIIILPLLIALVLACLGRQRRDKGRES